MSKAPPAVSIAKKLLSPQPSQTRLSLSKSALETGQVVGTSLRTQSRTKWACVFTSLVLTKVIDKCINTLVIAKDGREH